VVLDIQDERKIPLILGRPFLNTANATINIGAGEIIFTINGQEERFAFRPRLKQCKTRKDQEEQDASTSPTTEINHKE